MKKLKELLTARNSLFATVLVMLLLAAILCMGLLTPFILRLATGEKLLLDEAYFNKRAALPTLALVGLLAFCLMQGIMGKKESFGLLALGCFASGLSFFLSPFSNPVVDIAFPLLAVALFAVVYRLLSSKGSSFLQTVRKASSHIIHLGVVLLLVGILFSTNMNQEASAVITVGEIGNFESMGYDIKVTDISSGLEGKAFGKHLGSAYVSTIKFEVFRGNWLLEKGEVKYISDFKWQQAYTETYIRRGLLDELFIAPKAVDPKNLSVELYVRKVPFMTCLWGGFYLMAIGIILLILSDSVSGKVLKKRVSEKKKR